ncbi:Tfp pilus assembly protein PilO [Desulfitispora alkaliphila]|uniref:hypothetical protein n=1 Tax=Desulfitispora alkaliphila TaxID=622674 RepID=UPI003D1B676E
MFYLKRQSQIKLRRGILILITCFFIFVSSYYGYLSHKKSITEREIGESYEILNRHASVEEIYRMRERLEKHIMNIDENADFFFKSDAVMTSINHLTQSNNLEIIKISFSNQRDHVYGSENDIQEKEIQLHIKGSTNNIIQALQDITDHKANLEINDVRINFENENEASGYLRITAYRKNVLY